ncbi:MAG: hypothetical protein IKD74_04790 [Clostridia bacterium]|nr:hypothetical protein [Clostridia bacterium]
MRSGYAAIYDEEVRHHNIVEEKHEHVEQVQKTEPVKHEEHKEKVSVKEKENSSQKSTTQREGSIITMILGYISSMIIDIVWVKHFAQGGYFSMAKGFNGRYINEASSLQNFTGSLFLSLIIIAAISGIAGFILSIIFHRFKVSKKHMIVYAIMFAIFFYIDIMYIGFSSQNVF